MKKNHRQNSGLKLNRSIQKAIACSVMSLFLCSSVQAQEPKNSDQPVPTQDLPPLKLPRIPGERNTPTPETKPAIPDLPAPRPQPAGPAVVRAALKADGTQYFKLYYHGKPIGWSKYRVTGNMKLGETDAVIINSEGELRVGFDTVKPSKFKSRLMLDRKSLRPAYYKCVQGTDEDRTFQVECVYSESMVAQTNINGDQRSVHFHNFEGESPQLVFNNLWGHLDTFPEHYWIMARSAVKGGRIKAYDPILRGEGEVVVYTPITEDYQHQGRTIKTKVYDITDISGVMLASVRVAADSFDLLEVEEIGSGLKIVKSKAGLEGRMKDLEGVDLTDSRIVESNVVFPDAEQLTALEAEVEIDLRGGQLADHRIAGYRQYFTGELVEGLMKGRVFVRSVPREIPFDTPYPLDDKVPDKLDRFLKPGPGVEMEFPPLATKAREVAWKSRTTFEAAKRLNSFAYDLEDGVSLPSARYALESGVGNSESKALLLVAMNRALGLPARKISGIAFREGNWVPHHWVETWLGKDIGWTPFDPSSGEAGRIGAAHIALLDSGDVQNIGIKVTDYSPRGSKKVPYIARDLQWSVGEKRTYSVYRDGKKIGTEVAAVGDIEIIDGEELFRFKAQSQIESDAGPQVTKAKQLLTPQALPKKIEIDYIDPSKSKSNTYSFTEDTVVIKAGKSGDEGFEDKQGREYPFAKGTYFTEPRLLSQWALVAGQVPLEPGAEKSFPVHSFVPSSKKQTEMSLEVSEKEEVRLAPTLGTDKRKDEGEEDSEKPESAEPEKPTENQPQEPEVKTVMATHLATDSGIEFWLNDQSQVVKMEIPDQGIEMILDKVETSLD